MSNYVLECEDLGIVFGGLAAVDKFNIQVAPREVAGLIGPNGAGKTTVFNLLTKVYEPTSGTIKLNGVDTKGQTTVSLSKAGIARTFQNIRLFGNLSVADNVIAAMNQSMKYSLFESTFRLPRYWKEEKAAREKALELLSIFDMQDLADGKSSSPPY
ncbi:MAG: ABC transporter ATP-binding protein, partial [Firmicutes bacterium]|nr:ABC transporter ATP-binding protein [Bacillota bacterium]